MDLQRDSGTQQDPGHNSVHQEGNFPYNDDHQGHIREEDSIKSENDLLSDSDNTSQKTICRTMTFSIEVLNTTRLSTTKLNSMAEPVTRRRHLYQIRNDYIVFVFTDFMRARHPLAV